MPLRHILCQLSSQLLRYDIIADTYTCNIIIIIITRLILNTLSLLMLISPAGLPLMPWPFLLSTLTPQYINTATRCIDDFHCATYCLFSLHAVTSYAYATAAATRIDSRQRHHRLHFWLDATGRHNRQLRHISRRHCRRHAGNIAANRQITFNAYVTSSSLPRLHCHTIAADTLAPPRCHNSAILLRYQMARLPILPATATLPISVTATVNKPRFPDCRDTSILRPVTAVTHITTRYVTIDTNILISYVYYDGRYWRAG